MHACMHAQFETTFYLFMEYCLGRIRHFLACVHTAVLLWPLGPWYHFLVLLTTGLYLYLAFTSQTNVLWKHIGCVAELQGTKSSECDQTIKERIVWEKNRACGRTGGHGKLPEGTDIRKSRNIYGSIWKWTKSRNNLRTLYKQIRIYTQSYTKSTHIYIYVWILCMIVCIFVFVCKVFVDCS